MKYLLQLLLIFLFLACNESEEPNVPEPIPQNAIQIGDQIWMKENLKVKTFRNGDPIAESKTTEEWIRLYNEEEPAWTVYLWENDSERLYGVIYNYYAMIDPRGLAPDGWRIPTSTDFFELVEFNGGAINAPIKLMSKNLWKRNPGNNESGFNVTPGSEIWAGGSFGFRNEYVTYWTSSLSTNGNLIFININDEITQELSFNSSNPLSRVLQDKAGFYIRCIIE